MADYAPNSYENFNLQRRSTNKVFQTTLSFTEMRNEQPDALRIETNWCRSPSQKLIVTIVAGSVVAPFAVVRSRSLYKERNSTCGLCLKATFLHLHRKKKRMTGGERVLIEHVDLSKDNVIFHTKINDREKENKYCLHFELLQDAINNGRSKDILALYPDYDTDFNLLRWLMGWDYNIDEIIPKMTNSIRVLTNLNLTDLNPQTTSDINKHIGSMTTGVEYFPGGLMGQDGEGNVIYVQPMAQTHPKTIVKVGAVSELFRVCITETESSMKLVRRHEEKTGQKLGVKIVIDMDGFSMDLVYAPTIKIYGSLLTLMQEIFPDYARKIYLINAPLMMQTVYTMISPCLSKQTKAKVTFLGPDWKDILLEELKEENVYPHWGGTKVCDKPTGEIRMGGKVPEKLWYSPENNPDDGDKKEFIKLSIPARSREEACISSDLFAVGNSLFTSDFRSVPRYKPVAFYSLVIFHGVKGKTIRWIWRVSSGDIDFSVEYNGIEVYPKFRVSTEFHPEIGQFKCKDTGEFTFYFDNTHGKVFAKDVKYKFFLE